MLARVSAADDPVEAAVQVEWLGAVRYADEKAGVMGKVVGSGEHHPTDCWYQNRQR